MAANDDFARGLRIQVQANTTAVIPITFPASPGVSWVLTEAFAAALIDPGSPGDFVAQLMLVTATPDYNGGSGNAIMDQTTINITVSPGAEQGYKLSWDGEIIFPLGVALILQLNPVSGPVLAAQIAMVQATAYPI